MTQLLIMLLMVILSYGICIYTYAMWMYRCHPYIESTDTLIKGTTIHAKSLTTRKHLGHFLHVHWLCISPSLECAMCPPP